MGVPYIDLDAQHRPYKEEFNAAIQKVIDYSAFSGGMFVEGFEEKFSEYCQCRHAVGVGSGTDALWFALIALGVEPGDEVITVSNSFIATAEAISRAGATPVFVDIDENTYTMNPAAMEEVITSRTKAVIPVHLFGQMVDMDPIIEIARRHSICVIEDAAQAHGAEYKGRRAGSLGDVGCFSFYPGKNLGAFGEAGAAVTQDAGLAKKIKMLRDHGQSKKYHSAMVGWNGRMDGIQAAILTIKLDYLNKGNRLRYDHALCYDKELENCVVIPVRASYANHIYHVYAIRVKNRDRVMEALKERGIECGIHYPVPIHFQEAYAHLGYREGMLPVTEKCAEELLSLPIFPELTTGQIAEVIRSLKESIKVAPENGAKGEMKD